MLMLRSVSPTGPRRWPQEPEGVADLVPHLGGFAEAVLPSGRVLSGREANPGGEIATLCKGLC